MTDPVLEALREIAPVTRGQVNLGGRTLPGLMDWMPGPGTGGRGHPRVRPVI